MTPAKHISLRVTEEEHGAWRAAAEAEELPLQTWIRRRVDLDLLGEEAWQRIEEGRKEHQREVLKKARAAKAAKG